MGVRLDDVPAFGFQHRCGALVSDALAHGELESFVGEGGQVEEALELEILLAEFLALEILRRVARPIHHGRPVSLRGGRLSGLPIIQGDRLNGWSPCETRLGDFATGLADVEAKRKLAFVGGDMLRVVRVGICREADLGEHRIAIEEKFPRNSGGFGSQPAGP